MLILRADNQPWATFVSLVERQGAAPCSRAGRDGGGPGGIAYATSKGALLTMTRGLAKEPGLHGIRVDAVCPGMIATTFHDTSTKAEVRRNVAAAVAFLTSGDGALVTGIGLDVNRGTWFS